jgi:tetratricopeptide (TPR) repeat protein
MGRHFDHGQALFDLKRYRDACDAYRAELVGNPDVAIVHAMLAAALINLGNIREAEVSVRRALEFAPNMAYAHFVLSFIHERRGRLGAAERSILEAVRLEQAPGNFHRWAVIAERRGKIDDAMAATAQALRLDARHNESILLRGKLLSRQSKLEEAHALFSAALANNPQDAAAQHAFGSLQLLRGNDDAALGTLREARRLDPNNTNDAAAIALAYGRLIWPLNILNTVIIRWPTYSQKPRTLFLFSVAMTLIFGIKAAGGSLVQGGIHTYSIYICLVVTNYLALPFSFERVAATVGFFALRKEFRPRLHHLILRPIELLPAVWVHCVAVGIAFVICIPAMAVTAALSIAAFPLLSVSVTTSVARVAGWVCLPLYFALMIIGTLGAIIVDLESLLLGLPIVIAVFAVAYFSGDIAERTSSWRFRRKSNFVEV